jgi:hypothetical protein
LALGEIHVGLDGVKGEVAHIFGQLWIPVASAGPSGPRARSHQAGSGSRRR